MQIRDTSAPLRYFREISKIPRTSGHEEKIREYLCDFAKRRGLPYSVDGAGNVTIRKPGRSGSDPVVLQAHMDMVGEKISSSDHDFLTDPIEIVTDGDILHADGTTLGADNGIGMSVILSLLDSDEINAPHLECVFTEEEETGLTGAAAYDFAALEGRKLINLDSEGEGTATIGCAGGARCDISLPVYAREMTGTDIKISIDGLAGGHSGEDIDRRRTNACLLLADIVYSAIQNLRNGGEKYALVSLCCDGKDNAIPRSASAVVRCSDAEAFMTEVDRILEEKLAYLCDDDMLCRVSVWAVNSGKCAISDDVFKLLSELPSGVLVRDEALGCVRASANIGIVHAGEDGINLCLLARSPSDSLMDQIIAKAEDLVKDCGGELKCTSRYPGWDGRNDSPLCRIYGGAVREVLEKDADFRVIHAGLECGIIAGKVPEMDAISIGPEIKNMHSPKEWVSVSSVERFMRIVCIMLENL